ncbi:5'-methylthioadenosine/S-adenosylhomocysteine nucleosidase [Nocardia cyriacigeorgica]|uniref:5'-methylthioadenosine/S-adenosylhomocysteine nucleosidase n=1 Tax=Nocardia cyriacigeorgica TaxID=135487 RepID=A0A6P1D0N1_9NOCA|nr:5'-methylthioadenosine/S-adenosylhomocysteine nucleosidase [Nocardia cyriacigeorgica]MBF6497410.1 5'-methylthioadenosine/S-adenosylhomocysteine nucleosidase [Nocardia cyriacigeorgica]NEW36105.1 5'-methylthioadenosine/S-adenosylhomocysteine nucleosidase [Nocardia cyriacigeorgica]
MIVILTALGIEQDAVLEHLDDVEVHEHDKGTLFEVGAIAGHPRHRVAVGITGAGTTTAATLTERARAEFSPQVMMFVGVAGGLRDTLAIGDVVVATKIHSYQGGRSEDEEFLVRPRSWELSHRLDQAARRVSRGHRWREFLLDGPVDRPEPEVFFEPIAVGDVVLNSRRSDIARRIHSSYNDAIAVEMEGSGFAHAAALGDQVPAVVIRGISDHANGTKARSDRAGSQAIAARSAAAFAIAFATALPPKPRKTTPDPHPGIPPMPPIHNEVIARDNAKVDKQIGMQFTWGQR